VSMSDVVIRSTENGPNLVILDGKVVHASCGCGGSTIMPFSRVRGGRIR
jgi:CDGSH-type Zn-finger protein